MGLVGTSLRRRRDDQDGMEKGKDNGRKKERKKKSVIETRKQNGSGAERGVFAGEADLPSCSCHVGRRCLP